MPSVSRILFCRILLLVRLSAREGGKDWHSMSSIYRAMTRIRCTPTDETLNCTLSAHKGNLHCACMARVQYVARVLITVQYVQDWQSWLTCFHRDRGVLAIGTLSCSRRSGHLPTSLLHFSERFLELSLHSSLFFFGIRKIHGPCATGHFQVFKPQRSLQGFL